MKRFDLAVTPREANGKGPSRQLRLAGRIPGVIYGSTDPQKVSLDYREFERIMKGGGEKGLLDLKLDGEKNAGVAILREIQKDPVTRRYLHVDLYSIRMDQENTFEVALQSNGTPIGVRLGGILETHLRKVTVRCLPTKLPTSIEVDIAELNTGQTIHVSDLPIPEGVTLVTEPGEVVYTVTQIRGEKAAAEGEPEAAQPEVIGKKKEEAAPAKK